MNVWKRSAWMIVLAPAFALGGEPGWVELESLSDWKGPTGAWVEAGDARPKGDNPKLLEALPGKGAIVNGPTGRTTNLVTKEKYGDLELHAEFLVPKGSNSGIKFMGLYEVQIFDSYGVEKPTGSDNGGIYPRAELLPKYHHIDDGYAPRVNASKAPGEWQSLDVIFRAPRFDAAGEKTANARFAKVVLNGQVIHEDLEVPAPTGHAWRIKEEPATGPLLLQADHGPVAFRAIRLRPLTSP